MRNLRLFNWSFFLFFTLIGFAFDGLIQIFKSGSIDDVVEPFLYLGLIIVIFIGLFVFTQKINVLLSRYYIVTGTIFFLFTLKLPFIPTISKLDDSSFLLFFSGAIIGGVFFTRRFLDYSKYPTIRWWLAIGLVFYFPPVLEFIWSTKKPINDVSLSASADAIKFKERPNIYLFSFDSLIPAINVEKYLDIPREKLQGVLNNFVSEIPNSWVNFVPSYPSLNSIMLLDSSPFQGGEFMGRRDTHTSKILRENGYKIIAGSPGGYFGPKGKWINERVSWGYEFQRSLLCLERASIVLKARFLFYCEINERIPLVGKLLRTLRLSTETAYSQPLPWRDVLIQEIGSNLSSQWPHFYFFYTYGPLVHTSQNFNYNDQEMRESFKLRYLTEIGRLESFLDGLFEFLNQSDPNSIVLIFGDHGPYLSRGADDEKFKTEDRHKIFMGFGRKGHSCNERAANFINPEMEYMTPSIRLLGIFSCLAGNQILGVQPVINQRIIEFLNDT